MFGWSSFPVIMIFFGQKKSNLRKLVQEWTGRRPQDEFLNSPDCIFDYTIPASTLLLSVITGPGNEPQVPYRGSELATVGITKVNYTFSRTIILPIGGYEPLGDHWIKEAPNAKRP